MFFIELIAPFWKFFIELIAPFIIKAKMLTKYAIKIYNITVINFM